MKPDKQLTADVKKAALEAGADLVGIGSIDRFEHAPPEAHPCSIFSKTQSVIALGCRMVRGARGCVRLCVDYLERTGCIEKQYHTPMVEGEQWVIEQPLE